MLDCIKKNKDGSYYPVGNYSRLLNAGCSWIYKGDFYNRSLKEQKERLERVLKDDSNILSKLTKNDKKLNDEESKDDDPELVLTV